MALWALAALAAASPPADLLTVLAAEEEAKVARGEVVVQMERGPERVKRFQVVGNIEAPVERVWQVYTDFARYTEIFQITGSQVRRQQGNTVYGWFYVTLFWPIGPRWTINETVLDPERYAFTYRRVEGTFKAYEGDVELTPVSPHRTRVRYSARVDPDTPLIPGWVLDYVQFTMLPTAITRVRDWLGALSARSASK